jgi:hypothetical protein
MIRTGERSGLLTRIAMTKAFRLCVQMKIVDCVSGTQIGHSRGRAD